MSKVAFNYDCLANIQSLVSNIHKSASLLSGDDVNKEASNDVVTGDLLQQNTNNNQHPIRFFADGNFKKNLDSLDQTLSDIKINGDTEKIELSKDQKDKIKDSLDSARLGLKELRKYVNENPDIEENHKKNCLKLVEKNIELYSYVRNEYEESGSTFPKKALNFVKSALLFSFDIVASTFKAAFAVIDGLKLLTSAAKSVIADICTTDLNLDKEEKSAEKAEARKTVVRGIKKDLVGSINDIKESFKKNFSVSEHISELKDYKVKKYEGRVRAGNSKDNDHNLTH